MIRAYFGGYRLPFEPFTARAGCEACDLCDQAPEPGDQMWHDRYGDLVCDDCMSDRREAGADAS